MSGERIETAGVVVAQARICPSCHDDHHEPGWLARHDAAVTAQADAEVRRLTAALAEANEARDIAQGQWRWYQARAERAEATLSEVAALAAEWRRTGKRLSALEVSDILARTQQTGADR